MVGSSLVRLLHEKGYSNLLTKTKNQLNLLDQLKTYRFLQNQKPDVVIIAAARVGGIFANNEYGADFIFQNIQIQNNLIHGSYLAGINKLIFLGSSCIYPRDCKQPIKEKYMLTGSLEPTNEPYAIAKIAGLKMIENYNKQYRTKYLCLMPCNLYGPNDNYDLRSSHFLPAMIRKIHDAKINKKKIVYLWGDGSPKRELMHVDDLSEAVIHFLNKKCTESFINIGTGKEKTIKQYAKILSKIIQYEGKLNFKTNKLNGTPRKLLDLRIAKKYNWKSKINFNKGVKQSYLDFKENYQK